MRPRRRGRHGLRPDILLTEDQANTALLALQDAERYRRGLTQSPCTVCAAAPYGMCAEHARDRAAAARYSAVASEIADIMPEQPPEARS